jgi:putative membrane protein
MGYMFESGFLGTGAPFFMDIVTIIVSLLPILIFGATSLAANGRYEQHKFFQLLIFVVSVIVVGYFEYGVRIGGGFEQFSQNSSLPYLFLISFLIFHICIAVITLILWVITIYLAYDKNYHFRTNGFQTTKHGKMGKLLSKWIILTSVTGIMVYVLLFVL